ncbi:Cytoplasmic tRNA 2-thiolation protein 2 [Tilletia horrida]|nr:Cytoplasmic tRNA 2-thiolation protein 2 [Tilletia horrida]
MTAAEGRSTVCVRCRVTPASLLLPQTGAYCPPCATDIFHIKAKLGLDRARGACLQHAQRISSSTLVKGKERQVDISGYGSGSARGIAIGFSGSDASLLLLHAVARYFLLDSTDVVQEEHGTGVTKSKRVKKDTRRMDTVAAIDVLYVDDGALKRTGSGNTATSQHAAQLAEIVRKVSPSFNFVHLRLEDVYRSRPTPEESAAVAAAAAELVLCTSAPSSSRRLFPDTATTDTLTPTQALQHLHDSINPPPSQMPRLSLPAALTRAEDLRRILTQRLLRSAARERGACALLLADTASSTAVRFIDAIAKGEGGKAAVEGAAAVWMNDLLICRPLREIMAQEVEYQIQKLGELRPEGIAQASYMRAKAEAGERSSIGRLTNDFIANLESNVASTVSTVTRTASKIVLDLPTNQEGRVDGSAAQTPVAATSSNQADKPLPSQTLFGSAAQRLIRMVDELPYWDETASERSNRAEPTSSGAVVVSRSDPCPLCGMPAQGQKAQGWKESISILASAPPPPPSDSGVNEDPKLNLSSKLCYGCALVLDTPPPLDRALTGAVSAVREPMPLPRFVLDAMQTLASSTNPSASKAEEVDLSALTIGPPIGQSADAPVPEEEVRLRKIDEAEMRARIGKFVLPDE